MRIFCFAANTLDAIINGVRSGVWTINPPSAPDDHTRIAIRVVKIARETWVFWSLGVRCEQSPSLSKPGSQS